MTPVVETSAAPLLSGRRALGPLLDRAGVVASSLCAVHCATVPALLVVAPAIGVALGHERWEWLFLSASFAVGVAALVPSFLRTGQAVALVVFAAGVGLVLVGKLAFDRAGAIECALSAAGASCIALAHVLNLRVVRRRAATRAAWSGPPNERAALAAGRDEACGGHGSCPPPRLPDATRAAPGPDATTRHVGTSG